MGCGEGVQQPVQESPTPQTHLEMPYIVWCNWYGYPKPGVDFAVLEPDSMYAGSPDSIMLLQHNLPYILDSCYSNDTAFQILYSFKQGKSIVYHIEHIRTGAFWMKAIFFRGSLEPFERVDTDNSMIRIWRKDGSINVFRGQSLVIQERERVISQVEFELLRQALVTRNVLEDAVIRGFRWEGCTLEDHSTIYGKQSGKLFYRSELASRNPEMLRAIYLADSLSGLNALPPYVHEAANN